MKIWFQNRRVKYKKEGSYDLNKEPCRCLRTCNTNRAKADTLATHENRATNENLATNETVTTQVKVDCSRCYETDSDSDLSLDRGDVCTMMDAENIKVLVREHGDREAVSDCADEGDETIDVSC